MRLAEREWEGDRPEEDLAVPFRPRSYPVKAVLFLRYPPDVIGPIKMGRTVEHQETRSNQAVLLVSSKETWPDHCDQAMS